MRENEIDAEMGSGNHSGTYQLGIALSIVACVGQSFICVASRKLWSVHFSVIQFSYALTSTVCMGLYVAFMPKAPSHIPFVFDSIWVYFEIMIASFFNVIA